MAEMKFTAYCPVDFFVTLLTLPLARITASEKLIEVAEIAVVAEVTMVN
jgi:hypothetical protein